MSTVLNFLYSLWNQIFYAITHIRLFDLLDIVIIAYIIYKGIRFLSESRGGQIVKGLLILAVAYLLSLWWNLACLHWVLSKVVDWAIIAIAIVFQPELRRALEKIGRSKIGDFGRGHPDDEAFIKRGIDSICRAATNMHDQKIGALIVFERTTQLGEIINTGTVLNANISSQLVGNIFYPKSPLHDGALIVREGRLHAAGCILPLTSNPDLNPQLGTRHRAAIGVSEISDAVVLVVSEETGKISLVQNGKIERGYDQVRLREELYRLMLQNQQENQKGGIGSYLKNIWLNIRSIFSGKGNR